MFFNLFLFLLFVFQITYIDGDCNENYLNQGTLQCFDLNALPNEEITNIIVFVEM